MFKRPGSKIKVIAEVFFWLSALIFIMFAFVTGFSSGKFQPLPFFMFLIVGPFGSYITALLIYGFGTLVSNSEKEHPDEEEED